MYACLICIFIHIHTCIYRHEVRLGYANNVRTNVRGPDVEKDIIKPLCYYGPTACPLTIYHKRAHYNI